MKNLFKNFIGRRQKRADARAAFPKPKTVDEEIRDLPEYHKLNEEFLAARDVWVNNRNYRKGNINKFIVQVLAAQRARDSFFAEKKQERGAA
ncbi:MAG: hypothetical protein LBR41_00010 [Rickettsiales bacterium]|jgi:hypothetical protein|nr:hypothetical protein [Rickettsiales bacterium]